MSKLECKLHAATISVLMQSTEILIDQAQESLEQLRKLNAPAALIDGQQLTLDALKMSRLSLIAAMQGMDDPMTDEQAAEWIEKGEATKDVLESEDFTEWAAGQADAEVEVETGGNVVRFGEHKTEQ